MLMAWWKSSAWQGSEPGAEDVAEGAEFQADATTCTSSATALEKAVTVQYHD